jgi:transposase
LQRLVAAHVESFPLQSVPFINELVHLPSRFIITLNYDDLVGFTAERQGLEVRRLNTLKPDELIEAHRRLTDKGSEPPPDNLEAVSIPPAGGFGACRANLGGRHNPARRCPVARSTWQVRDELWEAVRPSLPEHPPNPRGGRPRVDDRVCFNAIVFVLFTGDRVAASSGGDGLLAGDRAPSAGCVAGRWSVGALASRAARKLNGARRIDWSTSVVDGSHIRALLGGSTPGLAG